MLGTAAPPAKESEICIENHSPLVTGNVCSDSAADNNNIPNDNNNIGGANSELVLNAKRTEDDFEHSVVEHRNGLLLVQNVSKKCSAKETSSGGFDPEACGDVLGAKYPVNSPSERRKDLSSIIEHLKYRKCTANSEEDFSICFGDTSAADPETPAPQVKPRRRRMDRSNGASDSFVHHHNNNNNHTPVKNERLSPGTPDTSSRSRSVTPSSASHPGTPPAEHPPPVSALGGRNYSDFMRSLAAKYNNANPNDYFSAARNGFPGALDPARFKSNPAFQALIPQSLTNPLSKDADGAATAGGASPAAAKKPPDFASILNPFGHVNGLFPPLMDMSTTQTLMAMVRTAKEAELQTLLKGVRDSNSKRIRDSSSPLDLSSAATPPVAKRIRKTPKRSESESPNPPPRLHEDISSWSVDDVCNFVSGIDICAEYATNFREQRIDGAGLPLLTEEHLTSTMSMKLGPALKLRSVLAKKLGSCSICLHCSHCHNNSTSSPDPGVTSGAASDSGGGTS